MITPGNDARYLYFRLGLRLLFDVTLFRHRRRLLHSIIGVLFGLSTAAIGSTTLFVALHTITVLWYFIRELMCVCVNAKRHGTVGICAVKQSKTVVVVV